MLVALVGATGSGKSTALDVASSLGFNTLNMDTYVHELYKFKNPGYEAVSRALGSHFVDESGVNRKKLAEAVFADETVFARLKEAVYPLIAAKLKQLQGDWVIEMPAYTNDPAYWRPYFAAVILVSSPTRERAGRIAEKMTRVGNFSTTAVDNYLNLVNPHLSDPDFTVDNGGAVDDFKQAVQSVLKRVFNR